MAVFHGHRPTCALSSDVKSTFHFRSQRIYPAQTPSRRRRTPRIRRIAHRPAIVASRCAGLAELADATVSKTVVRKDVWVRVPHSAPLATHVRGARSPGVVPRHIFWGRGPQTPLGGFAPEPPSVGVRIGGTTSSGWDPGILLGSGVFLAFFCLGGSLNCVCRGRLAGNLRWRVACRGLLEGGALPDPLAGRCLCCGCTACVRGAYTWGVTVGDAGRWDAVGATPHLVGYPARNQRTRTSAPAITAAPTKTMP